MKIFDAHFHVIDYQFPVVANNGFHPDEFTIQDYEAHTRLLNICGGAVVSGSFQAFDQTYLIDSLSQLGPGFVGVANVPKQMSDSELDKLNAANVRAVRFNLKRGGSAAVEDLEYLSDKLFDRYEWHTELYVDSNDLHTLTTRLGVLKRFSIDHIGLSASGVDQLYYWAERGVKIKATGFGRIDFDPIPVLKKINDINPSSLMFGTDLPSTRAKTPFSIDDIELIKKNFSEEDQARIFHKNAEDWYKVTGVE